MGQRGIGRSFSLVTHARKAVKGGSRAKRSTGIVRAKQEPKLHAIMTRAQIKKAIAEAPKLTDEERRELHNAQRNARRSAPQRLRARRQAERHYRPGLWCWWLKEAIHKLANDLAAVNA